MVLYWEENKVDNAREVARAAAEAADAKELVAAAVKAVPAAQSLCVLQKECGVAQPSHPLLRYVGSVDATTCLLVFVVRPDHVSVGHLDNPETSIQPLLPQGSPATEVKEEEAPERLTVHLVGSFLTGDRSEEETEELSERLVYGVLQQLIDSKREFNLGTAAVLSTNTYMPEGIARPRVTDAAWDMKEQTLIPVKFEGEVPGRTLRGCRVSTPPLLLCPSSSALSSTTAAAVVRCLPVLCRRIQRPRTRLQRLSGCKQTNHCAIHCGSAAAAAVAIPL